MSHRENGKVRRRTGGGNSGDKHAHIDRPSAATLQKNFKFAEKDDKSKSRKKKDRTVRKSAVPDMNTVFQAFGAMERAKSGDSVSAMIDDPQPPKRVRKRTRTRTRTGGSTTKKTEAEPDIPVSPQSQPKSFTISAPLGPTTTKPSSTSTSRPSPVAVPVAVATARAKLVAALELASSAAPAREMVALQAIWKTASNTGGSKAGREGVAAVARERAQFWLGTEKVEEAELAGGAVGDAKEREAAAALNELASYVPRVVLRRAWYMRDGSSETGAKEGQQNAQSQWMGAGATSNTPLSAPSFEKFEAVVLFADISGFTALSETLSSLGTEGIETLTNSLNSFFSVLVHIIVSFGGDIVKFAGDAVIAHWPARDRGVLPALVLRAACAAEALHAQLHGFKVPGGKLTLHVGIGAGPLCGVTVGGEKRAEFLVAGDALRDAAAGEGDAKTGETCMSPSAFVLVMHALKGRVMPGNATVTMIPRSQVRRKLLEEGNSLSVLDGLDLKNGDTDDDETDISEFMNVNDAGGVLSTALRPSPALRAALLRFVPRAVHAFVGGGQSRGKYKAELRTVSVVFVSLGESYFGQIANAAKNAAELERLQGAVTRMQRVVDGYEGTVRQFIVDDKGSVLIAVWGLPPRSHPDDPVRALRAALQLVGTLRARHPSCSIGVTTGPCFCGDVGSVERREYAVVGDTVNLSARLMGLSPALGVTCDEATFRAAGREMQCEALTPTKVKGKKEPVKIYRVVGSRREAEEVAGGDGRDMLMRSNKSSRRLGGIAFATDESETSGPKIVGRKSEVEAAVKLFEWCKSFLDKKKKKRDGRSGKSGEEDKRKKKKNKKKNHETIGTDSEYSNSSDESESDEFDENDPARCVILEGESGTGKSHLIQSVCVQFPNVTALAGFGEPMQQLVSYSVWRDVLADLVFSQDESGKDGLQIRPEILQHVGVYAPLLNNVFETNVPENRECAQLSPQLRAEHLQATMESLLAYLLEPGTVVILEDAQWLDSASWSLLLAGQRSLIGVLFCVCTRPFVNASDRPFELTELLNDPASTTVITLQGHKEVKDTNDMIALVLKISPRYVPADVCKRIHSRALGNPGLVREMVLTLQDSGNLSVDLDTRQLTVAPGFADFIDNSMPRTADALVTHRVDNLSSWHQLLLKTASVLGQVFSEEALTAVRESVGTRPQGTGSRIKKTSSTTNGILMRSPRSAVNEEKNVTHIALEELASTELILPHKQADMWQFAANVRDVVYGLMLHSQKRELHSVVGDYLEGKYGGVRSQYPQMAYHFDRARQTAKAISYYTKSGGSALFTFSIKEAVNFFEHAIQLVEAQDEVASNAVAAEAAAQTLSPRSTKKAHFFSRRAKASPEEAESAAGDGALNKSKTQEDLTLKQMKNDTTDSEYAVGSLTHIALLRKLASAQNALGMKDSGALTARKALIYLGIRIPARGEKFKFRVKAALTGTIDAHAQREAVLLLGLLGRVMLEECSLTLAKYCAFVALELCDERMDALKGEVWPLCIECVNALKEPKKALAVIQEASTLKPIGLRAAIECSSAVYSMAVAEYGPAADRLASASAGFAEIGDQSAADHCQILSGYLELFSGSLRLARRKARDVARSAEKRRDLNAQVSALLFVYAADWVAQGFTYNTDHDAEAWGGVEEGRSRQAAKDNDTRGSKISVSKGDGNLIINRLDLSSAGTGSTRGSRVKRGTDAGARDSENSSTRSQSGRGFGIGRKASEAEPSADHGGAILAGTARAWQMITSISQWREVKSHLCVSERVSFDLLEAMLRCFSDCKRAIAIGVAVLDELGEVEPCCIDGWFGWVWLPELFYCLVCRVEHVEVGGGVNKTFLLDLMDRAIEMLAKYASAYSTAAPRHLLWRGVHSHLQNKASHRNLFRDALLLAEKLGMPAERERMEEFIGTLCDIDGNVVGTLSTPRGRFAKLKK